MIKILTGILIIAIIGTANGISLSVSSTNNYGTTFKDSIVMDGNIGINGGYAINENGIKEGMNILLDGSGALSEDTKVQMTRGVPHCIHAIFMKTAQNKGSGLVYSSTKACIDRQFINVASYLQTNSNIDHGEMYSDIGNKITMQDNANAVWHYENVQAESDLMYDGNGITDVPMKIKASPLP